jgi:hypothetical protein
MPTDPRYKGKGVDLPHRTRNRAISSTGDAPPDVCRYFGFPIAETLLLRHSGVKIPPRTIVPI